MPRELMSTDETKRLAELMDVIDQGLQTFVEVGRALGEIRSSRLFRSTHLTFPSFVLDSWGMSDRHARRLIAAVEVSDNVGGGPRGPILEKHARVLVGLAAEDQRAVWAKASEIAPRARDGRPRVTEKVVRAARRQVIGDGPEESDEGEGYEIECPRCHGKGTVPL